MKIVFPEEANNFYKGRFWSFYKKFWERAKNPNNSIKSKLFDQAIRGLTKGLFVKLAWNSLTQD